MKVLSLKRLPFGVALAAAMTTLLVLAVVGITLFSVNRDRQLFRAELVEQASLILNGIAAASEDELYDLETPALLGTLIALQEKSDVLSGAFYDSHGRLIADTDLPDSPILDLKPDPLGQSLFLTEQLYLEWQADRLVAGQAIQVGTQKLGAISVELSTAPLESKIKGVELQGASVAVAAILAGVLTSLFVSRLISRPIRELMETMQLVSEGDLDHRVAVSGSRELTQLAIALNEMIDARSSYETRLQQSNTQALAASQAKSEFLASMSHEIRTPMNAIIGTADLLCDTSLTEEQQQYVQMFQAAGNTLLALIDDILDLSKIESGHLSLESTPFDLGQLIEDTAQIFAIRAHGKGLELNTQVHPELITSQIGDPTRLRQVLTNLLGNAIKFTESGEVTLRVNPGAPGSLQFQVIDTGIGISQNKQKEVFERFTQADSSTTREYGGTGLGLSISQQLVELMGGRIWVESQEGQGSSFNFTAQLQSQDQESKWNTLPLVEHAQNLKVMVVDDNRTSRLILQEMLTSWGARVSVAADGPQALEELNRARQEEQRYQLVLLDCHMLGIDGFSATKGVEEGLIDPETTVLMVTSNNRIEGVASGQELGITRYLVKPLKRVDLLQAVTNILYPKRVTPEDAQFKPNPATLEQERPLHILLAEDNRDNRLLIKSYLKKTPHQVDIAEDGNIAVGKFTSGHYDLVLMDVQMPVMDGYSATNTIRIWEQQHGVEPTPIIALTAHALMEDIQKSLDAGCTSHLTKPIKKATLLKAVSEAAS